MQEEIKSEDRVFDFNKIFPIPTELEGTQSPTKIISQEEYDLQEERIAKGDLTENELKWGVSRGLTQELVDEYINKFGFADWYGWQDYNWDTKWNASESVFYGDRYEFNTAWSTPFNLLVELSKKYPKLTFSVDYADEDFGHNVGHYVLRNGEEIDCFIPDGGTYESIKMAMQVQYGEPIDYFDCNDDVFIEIYNDEELTNYEKILVDIAYDNEVYPTEDCEWDKLVLERFKEKAMVDEKYELVAIIQTELDKVEN